MLQVPQRQESPMPRRRRTMRRRASKSATSLPPTPPRHTSGGAAERLRGLRVASPEDEGSSDEDASIGSSRSSWSSSRLPQRGDDVSLADLDSDESSDAVIDLRRPPDCWVAALQPVSQDWIAIICTFDVDDEECKSAPAVDSELPTKTASFFDLAWCCVAAYA